MHSRSNSFSSKNSAHRLLLLGLALLQMVIIALLWNSPVLSQTPDPHADYQYHCANPYIPICAYDYVWVDTIEEVAQQQCDVQWSGRQGYAYYFNCKFDGIRDPPGWPAINLTYSQYYCYDGYQSSGMTSCDPNTAQSFSTGTWIWTRYNPAGYFLRVETPPNSEPLSCCQKVGHPINPANGAVIDTLNDMGTNAGSIPFKRFYSSLDTTTTHLGLGWHQTFDRRIVVKYSSLATQLYETSPSTSSFYGDAASACTSGFAELQSKEANWSGAVASYVNGNCQLTKNGVSAGSIQVYYTRGALALAATPVAYDVVRDDGQVVLFTVQGGVIMAPLGTGLRLTLTSSGYALSDGDDLIETYDTSGKLLSVTSRSGVVQTMSYDSSSRLSGVTDNFGHQLTLGYDGQNRLISVTRQ